MLSLGFIKILGNNRNLFKTSLTNGKAKLLNKNY